MRQSLSSIALASALVVAVASPERLIAQSAQTGRATAAVANAASPKASAGPTFTAEDVLDIVSYTVHDLSADGQWLAATSGARRDGLGIDYGRDGDPTYVRPNALQTWVIDTRTGTARPVFSDKRNVRDMQWSDDASRLALLVVDPKSGNLEPVVWERSTGKVTTARVPAGKYVAENSDIRWMPDGRVLVALRSFAVRKAIQDSFTVMTKGPVFVQSTKDPFLTWDALRRAGNLRSLVALDMKTGQSTELVPETMIASYDVARDGSVVTYSEDITKKTDYDVIRGTETKLMARTPAGVTRTLLPTLKGVTLVWSEDAAHYAYGKEGRVYVAALGDTVGRFVAGPAEVKAGDARRDAAADTSKEARERREKERFTVVRYSPANDALLLSNKEGYWLLDVASGAKELIVPSDSLPTSPRITAATWTQDGKHLYFTFASRSKWERGVLRYDRDTKQTRELARDGRFYTALRASKDGKTLVLNVAQGNRPADVYAADADLKNLRAIVHTNPQLAAKSFGPTELINYLDVDGHRKYGVVYYPVGYEKGKTYPTVFNPYEEFFDDAFDATANVLTANGYVVVKPSVDFDIGYPGEAWIKGVTAAANKLIEMGVADSSRLGVHGTSYGGYATNLLVTQTNRFKAAINISGKVDIISFYTDSPRLGVRNIHAAEKSQDRLGATLWQQPQKYVQHSAIMFADRIETPLMLITGDLDSNVPADNTREMYYAMRRLGKECIWVNYMAGGHGGGNATAADVLDYHRRILDWYDSKLKRPANKVATAQQ